jgi:hypothetical protein
MSAAAETYTDCRSETGITVGLVDAIITQVRLLRGRDLTDPAVVEAMKDLVADADWKSLQTALLSPRLLRSQAPYQPVH